MKHRVEYYWNDLTPVQKFRYWWKISGRKRYGHYAWSLIPVVAAACSTIWLDSMGDVLAVFGAFFLSTLYLEVAIAI